MGWVLKDTLKTTRTANEIKLAAEAEFTWADIKSFSDAVNTVTLVAGTSLTLAGLATLTKESAKASKLIQTWLMGIGSLNTLADMILDKYVSDDLTPLEEVLSEMVSLGGRCEMTTKFFEWTSASGNSTTWKQEVSYRRIS